MVCRSRCSVPLAVLLLIPSTLAAENSLASDAASVEALVPTLAFSGPPPAAPEVISRDAEGRATMPADFLA